MNATLKIILFGLGAICVNAGDAATLVGCARAGVAVKDPPGSTFETINFEALGQAAEHNFAAVPEGAWSPLELLYVEGLEEYRANGVISAATEARISNQAVETLTHHGVGAEAAERIVHEWTEQGLLAPDPRFPNVKVPFTVSETLRHQSEIVRDLFLTHRKAKTIDDLFVSISKEIESVRAFSRLASKGPQSMLEMRVKNLNEDLKAVEAVRNAEKTAYAQVPSAVLHRKFPYGFRNSKEFEGFSKDFIQAFGRENKSGIDPHQFRFFLTGSSVSGLSYERKIERVFRRPYGARSDLDMYVMVSPAVFKQLKGRFIQEAEPGRSIDYDVAENKLGLQKLGLMDVVAEYEKRLSGGAKKIAVNFVTPDYMQSAARDRGNEYIEMQR